MLNTCNRFVGSIGSRSALKSKIALEFRACQSIYGTSRRSMTNLTLTEDGIVDNVKSKIANKPSFEMASQSQVLESVLQTAQAKRMQKKGINFHSAISNWEKEKPQKVFMVIKYGVEDTRLALLKISSWLKKEYPQLEIYVEQDIYDEIKDDSTVDYQILTTENQKDTKIDFVVTIGGDGTLLNASSYFPGIFPPVISFSMGTLGFLLPFEIDAYQKVFENFLKGEYYTINRARLSAVKLGIDGKEVAQKGTRTALNEITVHRGSSQHMTTLECYINGQILTKTVADGIIVSTSTGSTAYSLSAGGPIMHPSMEGTIITPICPRSLSFRSVILPTDATIMLKVVESSRGETVYSVDGETMRHLKKGEAIEIKSSEHPMPCVSMNSTSTMWINKINQMLKFNQPISPIH